MMIKSFSDSMTGGWIYVSIVAVILTCASAASAQQQMTWTLDADFDQGLLINVNHDVVHDQLQLNHETAVLPFVTVAASDRGTIIRIDANTGDIIGEYRSTPQGELHNPSRTTVDRAGNVWAANRDQPRFPEQGEGSVLKIGVVLGGTRCDQNGIPIATGAYLKPPFLYCTAVDRDGDGLIRTSRGLGDIHGWQGNDVNSADDECILLYKRVPARNCRHISVDADNNVWVGGYSVQNVISSTMMKLDGQTGDILNLFEGLSCGGYGGLVNAAGDIFSSSLNGGGGPLLMMKPTGVATCLDDIRAYGLAEDPDGNIWATTFLTAKLYKLSSTGVVLSGFPVDLLGSQVRGLAVTPTDGHVWIACTGSNTLERRDSDGLLIKEFKLNMHTTTGLFPTGVAVDLNGKVWVTNADSDNVFRIDPTGDNGRGRIDLVVSLGTGARPYNYSDMTGAAYGDYLPLYGTWSIVHDGGAEDLIWQRLAWTSDEPGDSHVRVQARAADTREDLLKLPFVSFQNGVLRCDSLLQGRFVQLYVEFMRGSSPSNNPVLYDVELEGSARPTVISGSGSYCEGDSLRVVADPRFTQIRWNDGAGGTVRHVSAPGVYWYTGRTSLGCVISSDTITVNANPRPKPVLQASSTVKCAGEEAILTAQPGYISYRWEPGLPSDTGRTLRVGRPGAYRVAVVDSNGCVGLSPAIVITDYPVSTVQLEAVGDSVLCHDATTAVLRATPGFTRYIWSTGDSTVMNSYTVPDSGSYVVTAIDSNGCLAVSNPVAIRRAPRPLLTLALGGASTLCAGDTAVLIATPGFAHYRWSTGAQGAGNAIRSTTGGAFWVVATDARGCTVTSDTVTVTVLPVPVLTLRVRGDSVLCAGAQARLEATPGYDEYEWSSGATTSVPFTDVGAGGSYRVFVTDSNGCRAASNPVSIVVRDVPEVDLAVDGGPVLCRGASSTLHATPGYRRYRWSTGAVGTKSSIVVSDSGRYWVEVQDAYGCVGYSDTLHVIVADELLPVIVATNDTICVGGTVELDAGPGYARYSWSTGDTTRSILVDQAGSYHITVLSANGCSGDTTMQVYAEEMMAITMPDDTLCIGEGRPLDAGSGYMKYSWSTGDSTQSITVTSAGSYWVSVVTARGCVLRDTVQVFTWPVNPLVMEGNTVVCLGSSESYRIGGDSLSSVLWTISSGGVIDGSNDRRETRVRWTEAGIQALRVEMTLYPSGCPYDTTLLVRVEDIIAPPIEGDPRACEGKSAQLSVGPHEGNALWLLPDGNTRAGSDTLLTTQAGWHRFVAVSTAGCSDTSGIMVLALAAPDAVILGDTVFCEGDSTLLTAGGSFATARWLTASGALSAPSITLRTAGRIILESSSAEGCLARDTVMLRLNALPSPMIVGAGILVPGDSTDLCLALSYPEMTWNYPDGQTVSGLSCITVRDTGRYEVVVRDADGCVGTSEHILLASDIVASAIVGVPSYAVEPGDRLTVPLSLLSSSNLDAMPLTDWSAELRFDARVLMPVGTSDIGRLEGNDRIISLGGPYASAAQTLAEMEFLALLGPVDRTALHIDLFTWTGATVRTETRDGEVRLLVCTEGGDRLFDATGSLRLQQNRPNPFNAATVITFETIEAGYTELVVADMLGRRVQVLQQGDLFPGVYSLLFDAAALPTGQYFCILRTPSQLRTIRMQLIK
jgi:streptogramin lyase